jgi:hypothetical protein
LGLATVAPARQAAIAPPDRLNYCARRAGPQDNFENDCNSSPEPATRRRWDGENFAISEENR